MNKETVIAMMKERDFQYDLEIRHGKDKTLKYCFHSSPVYSRHHKDIVIIPSYSCNVYPDTEEFELAYIVPGSINILKTSKCGSVNNNDHFARICHKFGIAVQELYNAPGEETMSVPETEEQSMRCDRCCYWKEQNKNHYGTCTNENAVNYGCRTICFHKCSGKKRTVADYGRRNLWG